MAGAQGRSSSHDHASKADRDPSDPQRNCHTVVLLGYQGICDFFTTKLGFSVDFSYGDPPFYGAVKRDNARFALRLVCEPVFVGDIRQREHLLSASIEVNTAAEIKQLFLDFQISGVKFHHALKKEPWGARNFIVEDPDGNLILFAGPGD